MLRRGFRVKGLGFRVQGLVKGLKVRTYGFALNFDGSLGSDTSSAVTIGHLESGQNLVSGTCVSPTSTSTARERTWTGA